MADCLWTCVLHVILPIRGVEKARPQWWRTICAEKNGQWIFSST